MASVTSLLKSIDRSKLHAGVPLQSFSMGEVILIGVVGWFGRLVVGWLVGGWRGKERTGRKIVCLVDVLMTAHFPFFWESTSVAAPSSSSSCSTSRISTTLATCSPRAVAELSNEHRP